MHSLRWKLILMAVVIVFIPVYLLNRYAITYFDRYTRTDLESNMRHYAFFVSEQYKRSLNDDRVRVDAEAATTRAEDNGILVRMGAEVHAHVRVISKHGLVLFDSTGEDGIGTDLCDRPEVAEALEGRYSARNRLTVDRKFMYFYVAKPIKDDAKNVLGVAYVVAHTNPIVQAIQRMVANQRLATYIALTCAGLVATVMALTMTRRLRALMRETRSFAAGKTPMGRPPRGGDEIAELGRAIHRMADEIELRNVYNRDFIQTTLHELKTPLTAIRGAAEVLERLEPRAEADTEKTTQQRQRFLGIVGFQASRLMQLVGELRELTRVDVELSRAPRMDVDYGNFVKEAVARLADTFPEPHAELCVVVPDTPVHLRLVPGRIEQVIENLLDNAFRYTPSSGKVTITVEMGNPVRTTIADTGCGIAASNVTRVFDRFFTTERRQRPQDYGSGLGLAIAASIIRSHQGDIDVTSEIGKGSAFSFNIPRHN